MVEGIVSVENQQSLEQKLPRAVAQFLAMPQVLEQIQQSQSEQREQIAKLEEIQSLQGRSLQSLERLFVKQTEAVEALYGKQDCLEQTSRQQTLLSEQHYQQHVIEPLVRRVFPLIDMLLETASGSNGEPFPNAQTDLLEALRAELYELLAGYGIEPIRVTAGSQFEAKVMKPVRFVPTPRAKKDKKIESVVRPGFRRGERILRPVMVAVYRFKDSKESSNNL